jgi:elongation factor G
MHHQKGAFMSKYESKSIRNLAVIGHGGTGKTSFCESIFYISGKTDRPGRVDEGTSCMDYEPEEQKRHISISAATNHIDWDKHRINIIDTPV